MNKGYSRIFLAGICFLASSCTHSPKQFDSSITSAVEEEVRRPAEVAPVVPNRLATAAPKGTLGKLKSEASTMTGYTSPVLEKLRAPGSPRKESCDNFVNFVEGNHKDAFLVETDPATGIEKIIEKFDTYGIVVANENGEVIWEKYFKGAKPETIFRMYSVSKLFTVLSFGNLELTNELNRNDFVLKHLQGAIPSHYNFKEALKIDDLLTMSSGVPWCEYVSCSGRDALALTYSLGRKDVVGYYFNNAKKYPKKVAKPGEEYSYSAGNSSIIQAIMKAQLKDEYLNYPQKRILEKIGENRYAFEADGNNVYLGGSGLFMTTRGLAKLGLILANKGKYGDHQIVSESYVNDMTLDSLKSLKKKTTKKEIKDWEGPTGMGVWLNQGVDDNNQAFPSFMPDAPQNMIYGSGLQGKRLMIFPEDKKETDDGVVVARVGVENNFSAFWEPFSKFAYGCFRKDEKQKTPREYYEEKRLEMPKAASSSPRTTEARDDAKAIYDLVKYLVPLKISAIELCNCAFVSNFLKEDQSGNIDLENTLKVCKEYSKIDFSVLGPLAPQVVPENVEISSSSDLKSVSFSYFGKNSPWTGFKTTAHFYQQNPGLPGTCQITKDNEPTALEKILTDRKFSVLWTIYENMPEKDLIQKALSQSAKLTSAELQKLKDSTGQFYKWIQERIAEAKSAAAPK